MTHWAFSVAKTLIRHELDRYMATHAPSVRCHSVMLTTPEYCGCLMRDMWAESKLEAMFFAAEAHPEWHVESVT